MTIRLETPADYREVENLTREAFWNVYRPGCTEHYVLNRYRKSPDFIPELDFVMEEDGRIIGHVMFSKAELVLPDGTRKPSWTFGPISIHPDYKRKGYGLRLLNYALERARERGVGFLCMEGNIDFYKHAGFGLASRLGIHYHDMTWEEEVPFFLAKELIHGWLKTTGITDATYCPPEGYFVADENPEAFATYEATFPPKQKLRLPGQLGYEELNMNTIVLNTLEHGAAEQIRAVAPEAEIIETSEMKIAHCMGCNQCWLKTPGVCAIKDDYESIIKKLVDTENLWLVSDTCFGFIDWRGKRVMDRIVPMLNMYVEFRDCLERHELRYHPLNFGLLYKGEADRQFLEEWSQRVASNLGGQSLGVIKMKEGEPCI